MKLNSVALLLVKEMEHISAIDHATTGGSALKQVIYPNQFSLMVLITYSGVQVLTLSPLHYKAG